MRIILLILALGFSRVAKASSELPSSSPSTFTSSSPHLLPNRSLRLPNDTYPLSYHLHISSNTHLRDWRFTGNVTIDVEIRRSTNEIVLHAKNLSDIQITLRLLDNANPEADGELVNDVTYTYDPRATFLIVHPRENYQAFELGQRYRLQLVYSGIMDTRPRGLYWMGYEETLTNRTVYVAATQSEPTYGRLIFPCYDEPAFKSNYSIKLTHSSEYSAISNMPVLEVTNHGELTTTTFHTTPPMSTYLVAFVISDFEHISETYRGVTQSIYSSPTIKNKSRTILKNAVMTVAALENYFGMNYSLPKLDHVALKTNQGAAMENWGLITYKENNLLLQDTTNKHKWIKNTLMQTHEISHQWFGNLVSPEWWSYVWLNEGFATYFSYILTDLLYPNESIMDIFIRDVAENAYSISSFYEERPITYYVESERDVMGVFDVISYKRSACIIKMFHHAFDQKTFVRGITRYLRKFQYGVVNEMNLFDALQTELLERPQSLQQPWNTMIHDIMLSWTHSEWLPIVSVIRNCENDTITFRQRSIGPKSEHWWIPINFATTQSPSFELTHVEYFIPPQAEHTLNLEELHLQIEKEDWFIVNKQQTGFYHVFYDTDNLHAIARQLQQNHTVIHAMNRAALFQDLYILVERIEIESIDVLFELFKYLEFEDDLMPWSQVANTIEYLDYNLFDSTTHVLFKEFVHRLVTPTFLRLFRKHETGDDPMFNLVQKDILQMACQLDIPECLNYTHHLALEYIFKGIDLETDFSEYYALFDAILCMGVRHLSDEDFSRVIDLLHNTDHNSPYYDDIIYSLRCTQSHQHMLYFLNHLVGENSTKALLNKKESMMHLSYVYKSNLASRSVIWNYLDRNYKQLCQLPHFVHLFNNIAEFVSEHQKPQFYTLHQNIEKELQREQPSLRDSLILKDSNKVGKKVRNKELFLEKFEPQIHRWLLNELTQSGVIRAALNGSPSVGNGSERPIGLLRRASKVLRNALDINMMF